MHRSFMRGNINNFVMMLGDNYSQTILTRLVCMLLLKKSLHSDMVNIHIERDVRHLNQRLAMLEAGA